MSETGKKRPDERPQEASQDGLSYDAEMPPLIQDPSPRQQQRSLQVGGDKEPIADLERICEEFRKVFSELQQQIEIVELHLSGMQEAVRTKVAEVVEESVKCARQHLDDQRKRVFEIVSETNAALQRIAEHDKMRDTIKEAMQVTWNTLE